jgi:hypothetical protein
MAAVARDSAGLFLGASVLVSGDVTDPETLEVLACRQGLALASDLLLQRLVFASDCANVVKNVKRAAMGHYGQIVQEITSFQSIEFTHERRESNIDARNLARSCLYKGLGRYVWFISPLMGVCNSYFTLA